MSFPTWPTDINNITDSVFKNTILDGQVDISGTFYNRLGNVIIGDSANPDFDPSSNGITLNTTRICLGKDSSVTGDNGVAIGNSATTGLQENSISIGYNSIVDASNSVAIGPDASANGLNSIALGYNSGTGSYTNSVALGANSTVGANNVISLGDGTQKVGIGTTNPSEALSVNGNIGLVGSGPKYIRGGSDIVSLESEYALKIKSDWNNNNENIPADIIFYTGDSERMRIQRDGGNVGIGTTSPDNKLTIAGGAIQLSPFVNGSKKFAIYSESDKLQINPRTATGEYDNINGLIMNSSGYVGIGTTNPLTTLHVFGVLRIGASLDVFQTGGNDLYFNYNGTMKGFIHWNINGTRMNFTGQHRTFIENILHTDASNNQGLIVSANKNTYINMANKLEKGNKAITQNESLPLVSLSTKSKDKSCFGVISDSEDPEQRTDKFGNFVTPYEKEKGDTRIYINSVGEGAIWVSNKNGPLESGDYITTSDIPGYGEKQDDDILHNYTVAKITMDCDFNPQPQPKEIILKQEILDPSGNTIYENVLDDNGMLQWTNKLDGSGNIVYEYPYNLRYLDLSGNRYSKEEYNTKLANNEEVYIAAYVGCTYHCG